MVKQCRACGAAVTKRFVRVFGAQSSEAVHACPECSTWKALKKGAGTSPESDGTPTTSVNYDRESGERSRIEPPPQSRLRETADSVRMEGKHLVRAGPIGEGNEEGSKNGQVAAERHDVDDPAFGELLG